VVHIAVCGQMHGAVYWRQGDGWIRNSRDQVEVGTTESISYEEFQGPWRQFIRVRNEIHRLRTGQYPEAVFKEKRGTPCGAD
jgi:hypothetical protein